MKTSPQLNLIYIASTGRSGSTLLDMLLGSHSQIATAGEIQIWPHEILLNGFMLCGCGKPIPQCSFWQEMYKKVDPLHQPHPQIHFFRENHNMGKTLRWKYLLEFKIKNSSKNKMKHIENYQINNYQLFKAFIDVTEQKQGVKPKWIVDASKDPYRLLWLIKSRLFNIKVIHLLRDPCAFVYSMTKKYLDKYNKKILIIDVVKKSLSWLIHNYLINLIYRQYINQTDYLLIKYEFLVKEPEKVLSEVFNWLECENKNKYLINLYSREKHTIAGNQMRYSNNNKIFIDEKWKEKLPSFYQTIIKIITSQLRYQYKYY